MTLSAHRRQAVLIVAIVLALLRVVAQPAHAQAERPTWLANFVPATLWSGTDAAAVPFGVIPPFTPLLALATRDNRYLALNTRDQGIAYIDASAVGPVGAPYPAAVLTSSTGTVRVVQVEVASTMAEQTQGLMGRSALADNTGMLFDFPGDSTDSFWMKDTPLALSIAFVDDAGVVISVQDMAPESTDSHAAPAPYRYALEVPQGYFAQFSFGVGSRLQVALPNGRSS